MEQPLIQTFDSADACRLFSASSRSRPIIIGSTRVYHERILKPRACRSGRSYQPSFKALTRKRHYRASALNACFRIGGICSALVDVQPLQTADGRGYSVLESGPTAQWHSSEKSGFARLTERKWRLPAAAKLRPEPEKPHANLRAAQHWAFIRELPCVACGMAAPSEAAHVRPGVDGAGGISPQIVGFAQHWREQDSNSGPA